MNISFLRPLAVVALLGLAGAAQAAIMTAPVSASGDFTVTDTTGPGTPLSYDFNVQPTTNPNPVIFYDTNPPGGQDATSIATLLASAYTVPVATLVNASNCDSVAGGCTGTTSTSGSFSIAGVQAFDYLAIHLGGGELFFHWAQPITGMTLLALDGFPGGVSNYRSYLSTPVPGALALFLGALGFLGLRRKLAQREPAAPAMA
jgi:hypothetical protein